MVISYPNFLVKIGSYDISKCVGKKNLDLYSTNKKTKAFYSRPSCLEGTTQGVGIFFCCHKKED